MLILRNKTNSKFSYWPGSAWGYGAHIIKSGLCSPTINTVMLGHACHAVIGCLRKDDKKKLRCFFTVKKNIPYFSKTCKKHFYKLSRNSVKKYTVYFIFSVNCVILF